MKPTQNNRPQGPWRQHLTPEEAKAVELLEWQIGVIDTLRQELARRRQRIQNTAYNRSTRAPLRKRPAPAATGETRRAETA